jgi:AcrR family transcriptional regulator
MIGASRRSSVAGPKRGIADEAVRPALLDAAAQLLHDVGPGALTVRRLAAHVGTSTQAIYTQFGGKPGIVAALYREGFTRLETAMCDVEANDDPVEHVRALGRAYRAAALENPHFYDVMFGRAVPGFECDNDDRAHGLRSFVILVDAVQLALDAGRMGGRAEEIAAHLWICVHGHTSLELHGYAGDLDYEATLHASLAPFVG